MDEKWFIFLHLPQLCDISHVFLKMKANSSFIQMNFMTCMMCMWNICFKAEE